MVAEAAGLPVAVDVQRPGEAVEAPQRLLVVEGGVAYVQNTASRVPQTGIVAGKSPSLR
jgi:hypothetical protein